MFSPVKVWRNQKRIQSLLHKEGNIVAWTMVFVPPGAFSALAPYPVAVVTLETGENITAQVVDYELEALKTGQKVKTVLRKITEPTTDGIIPYGIKVKPI